MFRIMIANNDNLFRPSASRLCSSALRRRSRFARPSKHTVFRVVWPVTSALTVLRRPNAFAWLASISSPKRYASIKEMNGRRARCVSDSSTASRWLVHSLDSSALKIRKSAIVWVFFDIINLLRSFYLSMRCSELAIFYVMQRGWNRIRRTASEFQYFYMPKPRQIELSLLKGGLVGAQSSSLLYNHLSYMKIASILCAKSICWLQILSCVITLQCDCRWK